MVRRLRRCTEQVAHHRTLPRMRTAAHRVFFSKHKCNAMIELLQSTSRDKEDGDTVKGSRSGRFRGCGPVRASQLPNTLCGVLSFVDAAPRRHLATKEGGSAVLA